MNRGRGRTPVPVGRQAFLLLMVAGLFLLPVLAHADSLRATVAPLSIRLRTNAPSIFDVKVQREGAGILEGDLEIVFVFAGDVLIHQRLQNLALGSGTQTFRILTPPISPRWSYGGLDVHLRFVAKTGTIELGKFDLDPDSAEPTRNFVVAVCDGHSTGGRDGALWQSLRLESFYTANAKGGSFGATVPAFLDPVDFPSNPLFFTAFDIVLVEGEGFAQLREKQLTALARWVAAGGSLCVVPSAGLKEEHVRFLNALADDGPLVGKVSENGAWQMEGNQPRYLQSGLGRVVVEGRSGDEAARSRQRAAFLWKVSDAVARPIIAGESPPDLGPLITKARTEASRQSNAIANLLSFVLPEAPRLISPWTVVLVLVGFLLLVGPGDWFLLGVLRRRRWTWVLFPLAAAGCTGLLVFEAGRALGRSDLRGTVIITDLGRGGRVLRESRMELFLNGRDRPMTTDIRNALLFPLEDRRGEDTAVWFNGPLPAHYTVEQPLHQWRPQINRVTSFEGSAPVPNLPWDEIEAQLFRGTTPILAVTDIEALRGWDYTVHFRNDKRTVRGGTTGNMKNVVVSVEEGGVSTVSSLMDVFSSDNFSVSAVGRFGKFAARNAPHGGLGFDDLLLHDPENDRECLLVVYQRIPNGMQIYRRLCLKPE